MAISYSTWAKTCTAELYIANGDRKIVNKSKCNKSCT